MRDLSENEICHSCYMNQCMRAGVLFLLGILMLASIGGVWGELPETSIYRSYKWSYRGYVFTWEIYIPVKHYFGYVMIPLEERRKLGYGMLVTHDDPYIQSLASALLKKAKELGFGELDTANFVLAFVQDHYLKDDETTPYDDFPKFPLETLAEEGGDCEDSSILYAALMRAIGYDVILAKMAKHMAVGVAFSSAYPGGYVIYNGKRYYYAETTSSGWLIGMIPKPYQGKIVEVIPIPKNPEGTQLKLQKLIEEYLYNPEICKQIEERYNSLMKSHKDLLLKIAKLQSNITNLKMENSHLRLQVSRLNATIASLQPKAHLGDLMIRYAPIALISLILIITSIALLSYYAGKRAANP